MPEGHTIHRLARDHARDLVGHPLAVSSPQGRASEDAARLDGRVLTATDAHGKHLFHRYEGDLTLHIHLGLFGRFRRQASPAEEPRGQKRLRLTGPEWTWDLSGPTACAIIDAAHEDALRARLGPDPLRADGSGEEFAARLSRRSIPIGAALLDQKVIAGVGNVYRAEALFVEGIDPHAPSRSLSGEEVASLWETLRTMLRAGVRSGRIVTVDPAEVGRPRSRMRRGERLYAYKMDACRRCGTPIAREELAARTLFWCPTCQPKTPDAGAILTP